MARFPKIDSPCPYKSQLSAVLDGDFCRMCKRDVFDLSGWSDGERTAFLSGCETEVCVRYTLPIRPAIAAAALAAAAMTAPAYAQDTVSAAIEATIPDSELDQIFVGGIKDPKNARIVQVEDPADAALPELPVVFDEPAAVSSVKAKPAS